MAENALLTYHDLVSYLQMTDRSLRRYVARGEIPFRRIGGWWIRFDKSEIDAWLLKQTRRPRRQRRKTEATKVDDA